MFGWLMDHQFGGLGGPIFGEGSLETQPRIRVRA